MLQSILRVDSWLDVASLENVEEDHSFLFLKKNLMKSFFFFLICKTWIFWRNWKFWLVNFFFLKNLEILNFFKELKILIDDFFFFFEINLGSTSPMPLVPRPFWKFPSFFFFFFFFERFRKNWFFFFFEIWRFVHYQKVKKMKMKMKME